MEDSALFLFVTDLLLATFADALLRAVADDARLEVRRRKVEVTSAAGESFFFAAFAASSAAASALLRRVS